MAGNFEALIFAQDFSFAFVAASAPDSPNWLEMPSTL